MPASLNLAQRVAQTLRSGVWGHPRARLGFILRVMTPFKECLISSPELCFDVLMSFSGRLLFISCGSLNLVFTGVLRS